MTQEKRRKHKRKGANRMSGKVIPFVAEKKERPVAVQVSYCEKRGVVCSACGRPVEDCIC